MIEMEITKASSNMLTYNHIESEVAFKQAARDGNRIVLPEPDQLLIDIDNARAEESFRRQLVRFKELIDPGAEIVYDEPSKSGKEDHRHIIVRLTGTIDPDKRVLYQLMLGSDLRRELLSYVRVIEGDPHPTLFIEKGQKLLTTSIYNEGCCDECDGNHND